jgi:hypothetical protein
MSLYVTVFAGSAPIGGVFAGAVAEVWGAPAGFLLGAAISIFFVALTGWQLVVRHGAGADAEADALHRGHHAADDLPGRSAVNQ